MGKLKNGISAEASIIMRKKMEILKFWTKDISSNYNTEGTQTKRQLGTVGRYERKTERERQREGGGERDREPDLGAGSGVSNGCMM